MIGEIRILRVICVERLEGPVVLSALNVLLFDGHNTVFGHRVGGLKVDTKLKSVFKKFILTVLDLEINVILNG